MCYINKCSVLFFLQEWELDYSISEWIELDDEDIDDYSGNGDKTDDDVALNLEVEEEEEEDDLPNDVSVYMFGSVQ